MDPQSRAPTVLLTRPAAQSARFGADLAARFPGIPIVTSPLITPEFRRPALPDRQWGGLIFTSETGVAAARRIADDGYALPRRAFCIGDQTARVAGAEGFDAVSAQGDGQALMQLIQSSQVCGPLLYLHGAEVRMDVGSALNSAGFETVSAVGYIQRAQRFTAKVITLLRQTDPLLVPQFSARTGAVFAQEYVRVSGTAPLLVAAISADVGLELNAAGRRVAERPDAAAMLEAMAFWLA